LPLESSKQLLQQWIGKLAIKLFSAKIKSLCIKVVGWGKDENNRISKSPKLAVLPIVSQEECLRSRQEFYHITSNTTFCAGARDGYYFNGSSLKNQFLI